MKPIDIGKAYDRITHLWTRAGFDRDNGIVQHKRALSFVKNRRNALDVGCGCTGRFIDLLLREGFAPEGVDVSKGMLDLARSRHPEVVFHHQDICDWVIPDRYDFITAWDSIWHIPLGEHEQVLRKLIASLNPEGVLIFSFGGTSGAREHSDDAMGEEIYYSTLGTNGFVDMLIGQGCILRHLEYDQYPELHAYVIVQKS